MRAFFAPFTRDPKPPPPTHNGDSAIIFVRSKSIRSRRRSLYTTFFPLSFSFPPQSTVLLFWSNPYRQDVWSAGLDQGTASRSRECKRRRSTKAGKRKMERRSMMSRVSRGEEVSVRGEGVVMAGDTPFLATLHRLVRGSGRERTRTNPTNERTWNESRERKERSPPRRIRAAPRISNGDARAHLCRALVPPALEAARKKKPPRRRRRRRRCLRSRASSPSSRSRRSCFI